MHRHYNPVLRNSVRWRTILCVGPVALALAGCSGAAVPEGDIWHLVIQQRASGRGFADSSGFAALARKSGEPDASVVTQSPLGFAVYKFIKARLPMRADQFAAFMQSERFSCDFQGPPLNWPKGVHQEYTYPMGCWYFEQGATTTCSPGAAAAIEVITRPPYETITQFTLREMSWPGGPSGPGLCMVL